MLNRYRYPQAMGLVVLVVGMSLLLTACEPLRKKFTRQKRKSKEVQDFQPVLEPQEYPAPEQNPPENYKQHYSMVKVWYKDLWSALEDKNTDKRTRYTLNQVLSHIEEMKRLVFPEKQALLVALADYLKYFENSLNSPESLRNKSRIQSDLRAFDRMLRNQLRADKLEGFFVKVDK